MLVRCGRRASHPLTSVRSALAGAHTSTPGRPPTQMLYYMSVPPILACAAACSRALLIFMTLVSWGRRATREILEDEPRIL